MLNIIAMNLFTTALYESERTIVAPVMAHTAWNIIGMIILGGVNSAKIYPNFNIYNSYPSIFWLESSGNTLISGGKYMIEGSIVVTVLNILLIIFFLNRYRKNAKNSTC